ncbi:MULTISPECIES: helix-turn-helix domain-containing protein [Providencia]|nr:MULTISPECIES: helix-turn-helix transcriptional regulator [unclassified Providencia]UEK61654.1 helix-turn-helix transcriptional regulator [Providencia rettgeri]
MDSAEEKKFVNISYPISEFAYEIGREIYRLRKAKGITGKELAKMLKVSQQQISRYERGVCYMNFDTFLLSLFYLDENFDGFFFKVWGNLSKKNTTKYRKYGAVFNSLKIINEFSEHFSESFCKSK